MSKERADWDPVSDEDEAARTQPGKPNAYWADVRARQAFEEAREVGYSGDYRGVRLTPHGGAQFVRPEDTIGDYDLCWCGEPADHDWPGKDRGRKHPRNPRKASAMPTAATEAPHIDRRQVRAFHADLVDVIIRAVNDYGVRYRLSNNGCILYPPDGSQPFTIYARNTDRQVRDARKWFVGHVLTDDAKRALIKDKARILDDMDMKERTRLLAEKLNSEEHQVPPPEATEEIHVRENEPEPEPQPDPEPEAESSDDGWVPWFNKKGKPNEHFETDGTMVRCVECGWVTPADKTQGLMGHWMTNHDQEHRARMYGAESQDKKRETYARKKVEVNVGLAIEHLYKALGTEPPKPSTVDEKQVKDLDKQVADLTAALFKAQAERDEARAQYEDVKARLDLLREALSI